jgi:hypothetical protein
MPTTGDAPLSLIKPVPGDVISLSVLNSNYDTINANAATTGTALNTVNTTVAALQTQVTSGTVNNATKWGGRTLFVQSSTPTGMVSGDVWIQV